MYFSRVFSRLFQAKSGVCGLDTMKGFRGGAEVGDLLLAGLIYKINMFRSHVSLSILFNFPQLRSASSSLLVVSVFASIQTFIKTVKWIPGAECWRRFFGSLLQSCGGCWPHCELKENWLILPLLWSSTPSLYNYLCTDYEVIIILMSTRGMGN